MMHCVNNVRLVVEAKHATWWELHFKETRLRGEHTGWITELVLN